MMVPLLCFSRVTSVSASARNAVAHLRQAPGATAPRRPPRARPCASAGRPSAAAPGVRNSDRARDARSRKTSSSRAAPPPRARTRVISVMFSRASFTAGASSRRRSSTARALRTAAALNGSSSLTQDLARHVALRCCAASFGPELPALAIAHDPAGGRVAEMAADDQDLACPRNARRTPGGSARPAACPCRSSRDAAARRAEWDDASGPR